MMKRMLTEAAQIVLLACLGLLAAWISASALKAYADGLNLPV